MHLTWFGAAEPATDIVRRHIDAGEVHAETARLDTAIARRGLIPIGIEARLATDRHHHRDFVSRQSERRRRRLVLQLRLRRPQSHRGALLRRWRGHLIRRRFDYPLRVAATICVLALAAFVLAFAPLP